ncbi:MAG: DapH/DapD/GlmU-related protein [Promethearchaeota archaeon]
MQNKSIKIHEKADVHESTYLDDFIIIGKGVEIKENVYISSGVKIYGKALIEKDTFIGENCIIGHPNRTFLNSITIKKEPIHEHEGPLVHIGKGSLIRSGTIIYSGVSLGAHCQTGHNVLIRENTQIGERALIGTNTVIEGETNIGIEANIQSCVYIPLYCKIGDNVFLGPCSCQTNDKYMTRAGKELKGPFIKDEVSIGANSVILPGIQLESGTMVGAGSIVTKNSKKNDILVGNPAKFLKKKPTNWK